MKCCGSLWLIVAGCLAVLAWLSPARVDAGRARQYYSSWSYQDARGYYYRNYNYMVSSNSGTYSYHYAIYYPAQPRYVYYYNPYAGRYWGRLDTEAKGDNKYSLLADKDRKASLQEIPESAFPAPGLMPTIPEATDGIRMEAPPDDRPKGPPKDLPK